MSEPQKKKLALLRIDPQDKPIYVVIEAWTDGDDQESDQFLYDERQCPTDVLRAPKLIAVGGDLDPHGIATYVKTFDRPDFMDKGHNPDEEWRKILPELFDDADR